MISTRLKGGETIIHIYSDKNPRDGFEEAVPDLRDVYFTTLLELEGGR